MSRKGGTMLRRKSKRRKRRRRTRRRRRKRRYRKTRRNRKGRKKRRTMRGGAPPAGTTSWLEQDYGVKRAMVGLHATWPNATAAIKKSLEPPPPPPAKKH